jgi:hypothetical protein
MCGVVEVSDQPEVDVIAVGLCPDDQVFLIRVMGPPIGDSFHIDDGTRSRSVAAIIG